MSGIIAILVPALVLGFGTLGVVSFLGRVKKSAGKPKSRDSVVKDANKRLAQNPKDPSALMAVGDVYFKDQTWNLAYETYETLTNLAPAASLFLVNLRCGIAAAKLNKIEEAYKFLSSANQLEKDNFDLNYYLGSIEFQRKNFEKAVQHYQKARVKDPENAPTLRGLGHSLFKLKKYKDAMNFIRKSIDLAPGDKESFYTLAECYYEANQTEQALKIFSRLRADPVMGPEACLMSGTINSEQHQPDKAIEDFEIGLKHASIKPEVLLELKYQLASAYLEKQDIGRATSFLREINMANSSYKDVPVLLSRYQELNSNRNLQVYLMATQNDFIALCRKIVLGYYPRAKTKITNISVQKSEWADLLAEVDTPKWSEVVMFRFIRTQGSVGELIVRDFHSHIKETKAGKGVCVSVGAFSDEARHYTEARLIELIDKGKLTAILNNIDASGPRPAAKPTSAAPARPAAGKPAAAGTPVRPAAASPLSAAPGKAPQ